MMNKALYEAVLKYDEKSAVEIVKEQLNSGAEPTALINESLIPAMDEVGRKFSEGTLYMPEMFLAGKAFQACLNVIKPVLPSEGESQGRVVIGTVKGDMHDIGKNMVAMMLENGGFEVVDLGVDVPPERFLKTAEEKGAHIVAMSSLLTTTIPEMKTVIEAFEEKGIRKKLHIMIGGAPVTPAYADQIGADGYSKDAPGAVTLARQLLGGSKN